MFPRALHRFGAAAAALVLLAGCDPGYYRAPVDWPQPAPGVWVRHFDGFTLRVPRLAGLVGTWSLSPSFEISDNVVPVTLESATLFTSSGTYPGEINRLYGTVAKGGGNVLVWWEFGRGHWTPDVLGDRSHMVLEMLVGSRPVTVRIDYDRGGWRWA